MSLVDSLLLIGLTSLPGINMREHMPGGGSLRQWQSAPVTVAVCISASGSLR